MSQKDRPVTREEFDALNEFVRLGLYETIKQHGNCLKLIEAGLGKLVRDLSREREAWAKAARAVHEGRKPGESDVEYSERCFRAYSESCAGTQEWKEIVKRVDAWRKANAEAQEVTA